MEFPAYEFQGPKTHGKLSGDDCRFLTSSMPDHQRHRPRAGNLDDPLARISDRDEDVPSIVFTIIGNRSLTLSQMPDPAPPRKAGIWKAVWVNCGRIVVGVGIRVVRAKAQCGGAVRARRAVEIPQRCAGPVSAKVTPASPDDSVGSGPCVLSASPAGWPREVRQVWRTRVQCGKR